MTQTKKFDFRLIQENDTWTAQITRRMTARKTVVSKKKQGFESEADAQTWAETQLKAYLENLVKRNDRRAKQREERTVANEEKAQAAEAWREAKDASEEGNDFDPMNSDFNEENDDYSSDSEK